MPDTRIFVHFKFCPKSVLQDLFLFTTLHGFDFGILAISLAPKRCFWIGAYADGNSLFLQSPSGVDIDLEARGQIQIW